MSWRSVIGQDVVLADISLHHQMDKTVVYSLPRTGHSTVWHLVDVTRWCPGVCWLLENLIQARQTGPLLSLLTSVQTLELRQFEGSGVLSHNVTRFTESWFSLYYLMSDVSSLSGCWGWAAQSLSRTVIVWLCCEMWAITHLPTYLVSACLLSPLRHHPDVLHPSARGWEEDGGVFVVQLRWWLWEYLEYP